MTDANSRQFKSLDSIEFVQALTPETAANYSGGACTFATQLQLSEREIRNPVLIATIQEKT